MPSGRLAHGIAVVASGTLVSQAITIAVFPALTRLYAPEHFGVLAVYAAVVGVLGSIACLCYELAVPLAGNDRALANLLALALGVSLLMSLASAGFLWAWGDLIALWTNVPDRAEFFWLVPLGLLATGAFTALNYWAVQRAVFRHIAEAKLTQSIGQSSAQLGLGIAALGPAGLLIGQVLGQLAGVAAFVVALRRRDRHLWALARPSDLRRMAVRYRRFPLLSTGAVLLNSASRLLPALLLAVAYGTQVAGWFALAQRVLGAPMRLLGSAVAQVYLSEAPKLAARDPRSLLVLFTRATVRLLWAGLLCLGLIVSLGPQLFSLVFGAEWAETGRYVQLLATMYLAQIVVSPVSQTLNIFERQRLQLAWDAFRLAVLAMVFLLIPVFGWRPVTTITVMSIASTGCYGLHFILARRVILQSRAR